MSERQYRILNELRNAGRYGMPVSTFAHVLDAPQPSIRRDIQALRRLGYIISLYDSVIRLDHER